jgi:hypothetical protein
MRLFTAATLAIFMSSGVAFAQDNTQTGSTTGADTDPAAYLAGPKTQTLFTDDTRTSVRPPEEFKAAWEALNPADREDIKQACSANRDVSYNPLCTNAKAM